MQAASVSFEERAALDAAGGQTLLVAHNLEIHAKAFINPLPHVLMLTAIVVSVATLGVALALAIKVNQQYGTLEEDEIAAQIDKT